MQKEIQSILQSIDIPAHMPFDRIVLGSELACKDVYQKHDVCASNLLIIGKDYSENRKAILFDVDRYKYYSSFTETCEIIIKDIVESNIYKQIECINMQSLIKYTKIEVPSGNRVEGSGIIFITQFNDRKEVKSFIKNNGVINTIEEKNNNTLLVDAEAKFPDLKKYITLNNNKMATATKPQNSIWNSLNIEKTSFDWIDEIISESKTLQRNLTDTIRIIVREVRNKEFGISGQSAELESSEYELKLFLAGKIFEEKLRKEN